WRASPETIALGQQRALARNVFDVADENLTVEQAVHDLLGGQTLLKRDSVRDDLAFHHGLDHVADTRMPAKHIFAGLEIGARPERDHSAQEDHRMLVDHALPSQQVGNIQDAKARWNIHRLLPLQRARRLEPPLSNRK